MALCNGNTLNAESVMATKERIKEIKFVGDINIEKLIRNKTTRLASTTSNYIRSSMITARNLETSRVETKNEDNNNEDKKEDKVENKTEKKETTVKEANKKSKKTKRIKKEKATNKKEKVVETTKTNKKETKKENKNEEKQEETKKIEQKTNNKSTGKIKVSISRNMDLTKRTGLSKEEFKNLLKHLSQDTSKFFYNNADTIYDLCAKYQINEIFFCGLISAESGWNIAGNHRKTHNYISLMLNGKLIHYSSTSEGLKVAAQKLHGNYLTPGGKFYGGKTLAGVQKKFCPSGTWISLVYGRMSQVAAAAKKIK